MAGSSRSAIRDAFVTLFKTIDGTGNFQSNLFNNVTNRLQFFDEVNDFPTVSVVNGDERRQYLPGGFQWGFLEITIRAYVNGEDPESLLEGVLFDLEVLIDANNDLAFNSTQLEEIKILGISTDGGTLEPIGFGEMTIECRYQVQ